MTPDVVSIKKQAETWKKYYSENNDRGEDAISFCSEEKQWESDVITQRELANKESLTFNLCLKHLKKIKSQFDQIDFQLNICPSNVKDYDAEELKSFRLLLNHFIMSDDSSKSFDFAWQKAMDYGYSFLEINFKEEGEKTLSLMPTIIKHEDPACAFWDPSATSYTKIDGRYCGIKHILSKEEVINKFPNIRNKGYLTEKNNIIRYWYREEKEIDFILLTTGEYKRADLIEQDDKKYYKNGVDIVKKQGKKSCIYFMIICNDVIISKPELFPTDDLPIVYHNALTVWTKNGYKTFPFIYSLKGAQKLHNFTMSQIATLAKNSSSTKVFLTPDHIQSEQQILTAQQMNQIEGAVVLGEKADGSGRPPQIVPPAEIPITMLNLANQTKQEIDEISGAFIDADLTSQSMVSGKALALITQNMNISSINAHLISSQIIFINDVCKLFQQMIPNIVTEQREITIKKDDGTSDNIYVNKLMPSGLIKNNIKDIRNKFLYEITSGPNYEMQQEASLRALTAFYSVPITPDFMATKDLFARSLPIKDLAEFERRITSNMDPMLLKYSNGEITKEEYTQYLQKQQQVAQQQQMQMMQMQQQQIQMAQQAAMQKLDIENKRAESLQFNDETKRMKAVSEIENAETQTAINLATVQGEQEMKVADHMLAKEHNQLEIAKLANQQFKEQQELNANS